MRRWIGIRPVERTPVVAGDSQADRFRMLAVLILDQQKIADLPIR